MLAGASTHRTLREPVSYLSLLRTACMFPLRLSIPFLCFHPNFLALVTLLARTGLTLFSLPQFWQLIVQVRSQSHLLIATVCIQCGTKFCLFFPPPRSPGQLSREGLLAKQLSEDHSEGQMEAGRPSRWHPMAQAPKTPVAAERARAVGGGSGVG